MNRKLAKKLTNTVNLQHQIEDEEAGLGARGNYAQSSRRGNSVPPPPQQSANDDDDEAEDELSRPAGRHQRPFETPPSNPFSYYDRQGQSRTDLTSTERIPTAVPPLNPRLGASILRMPSPSPSKAITPQPAADRYRDDDLDDDDSDGDDDEDQDEYESNTSLRMSRDQSRSRDSKLVRKEKQLNIKKGSTTGSSGGQRGQQNDDKKVTSVTRKGSGGKDQVNQGQQNTGEAKRSSRNRDRDRDRGGSNASVSGNGNYIPSGSNSRMGRSGSAGNSRSGIEVSRNHLQALPIEIPEGVADVDAFRRYLSVRRGAVGPLTHTPLPSFEDHNSDSVVESVGGGYGPPYGSTKSKHLNSVTGLAGAAAASLLVQRKSMALSHAIMTLALLSASASQLRFVVAYSNAHSYPALNYFLICSCIFVEILVGIGYVIVSRFEFSERVLDKTNSFLIFGLFFVAIANVIIASFALDDHVCEVLAVLAKQKEREQFDTIDNTAPAVVAAHQNVA